MKLHDLQVGQRFTFTDKHRGKVFEVIRSDTRIVVYRDVATNEFRHAYSNREMFRKEVMPITDNRLVELTPHEVDMLKQVLHERYLLMCETGYSEASKSEMNKLIIKITGLPGRRVVLPEDVNPSPNGE
jgi:hypothetical protein